MRRAHGFIVLVDVTNPAWDSDVREICNKLAYENRQDAMKVLVANKIDLPERAFSVVAGYDLASELGFADYFEISLQKRINAQKPIETLV
jgi:signal recognition particle receptor subunit beta